VPSIKTQKGMEGAPKTKQKNGKRAPWKKRKKQLVRSADNDHQHWKEWTSYNPLG
jgi:hypothetical protein